MVAVDGPASGGFLASCTPCAWIAVVSGVFGGGRGYENLAGVAPRATRLLGFAAHFSQTSGIPRGLGRAFDPGRCLCLVPCGCVGVVLGLGMVLPKGVMRGREGFLAICKVLCATYMCGLAYFLSPYLWVGELIGTLLPPCSLQAGYLYVLSYVISHSLPIRISLLPKQCDA